MKLSMSFSVKSMWLVWRMHECVGLEFSEE